MPYLKELVWLPNKALNNAYARTSFCFIQDTSPILWTIILYHLHFSNFFPLLLVVIISSIRSESSHLFITKSTHPPAFAPIPLTLPPSCQRTVSHSTCAKHQAPTYLCRGLTTGYLLSLLYLQLLSLPGTSQHANMLHFPPTSFDFDISLQS